MKLNQIEEFWNSVNSLLANSLFSLRDVNLTLGLLPPSPYKKRQVAWRDSVGVERCRLGLKSECADIFHQSFLWLLRHTDEPQRGRNSCLWLQSRSVLSSFGVVLMSCRVNSIAVFCLQNLICLLFIFADQVFIDPTFFGIFVCSPLWLMFVLFKWRFWFVVIQKFYYPGNVT